MVWLTCRLFITCTSSFAHMLNCLSSTPADQMLITKTDQQLSHSTSDPWILIKGCYKKRREKAIASYRHRLKISDSFTYLEEKKLFDTQNQSAKKIKATSVKFSPWKCYWSSRWWWDSPCTLAQLQVLQVGFSVMVWMYQFFYHALIWCYGRAWHHKRVTESLRLIPQCAVLCLSI